MIQFKIYPFRKRKDAFDKKSWWTVTIYKTPEELRKHTVGKKCKTCKHGLGGSKDCLGLTHSHSFKTHCDEFGQMSKPDCNGELGLVFIQEKNDGSGVVTHELCHAMMYTVMRFTPVINFFDSLWTQADEKMAGIMGNLANTYWRERLGV